MMLQSSHKNISRGGEVQEVKLHLMSGLSLGSVLEESRRPTGKTPTATQSSIPTIPTSTSTSPRRVPPPLLIEGPPPPPPGAAVINWIANRGNNTLPSNPSPRNHPNNNNKNANTLISTMNSTASSDKLVSASTVAVESREQRFARRQLVKHSRKKLPLQVSQSQLVQHAGTLGGGMEEDLANTVSGVCPSSYTIGGSRSAAYSATASALAIAPLNMSKLNDMSCFAGTATLSSGMYNTNTIVSGRSRRSVSSSTSEDSETTFPLYGGPAQHSRPTATDKTLQKLVEPTDVRARVKHTSSSRAPVATTPHQSHAPASSAPPIFPSASQSFIANQLVISDISAKFGNSGRRNGGGTKSGSCRRTKPERLRLRNFVEAKQKASCLHADGPFSNGTIQSLRITVPSTGRTFPQQHATLMLAHALREQLLPNEAIHRMNLLEEEHAAFEYLLADHLITFKALEWGRQQRYLAFHATADTVVGGPPAPSHNDENGKPATPSSSTEMGAVHPTSERPPMTKEERSRLVASVLNEYRAYEEQFHNLSPTSTDIVKGTESEEVLGGGYSTQVMQPRTIRVFNDEQGSKIGDRSEEAARRFIVASVKRKMHEEQRRAKEAAILVGSCSATNGGGGGWKVTSGGQKHHVLRASEPIPLSATLHPIHQGGLHGGHSTTIHPQTHQREVDDIADCVALELGNFTLLGSTLTGGTDLPHYYHNNSIPTNHADGEGGDAKMYATDAGKFITTDSKIDRPVSHKSFVTPRPPAVEAIHTRNQHVGRQIRVERQERNQQLAAAALLDHQPHHSQQPQPKTATITTIVPMTTLPLADDVPVVGIDKERPHTHASGAEDPLKPETVTVDEHPKPTPPTSDAKPAPRPAATYVTPSPLSPRTTIQTSKSVVLKDDVISGFLTSAPLVGLAKNMGPLVSPAVPFPRKHITSICHRPKAHNTSTVSTKSSTVKLTHSPLSPSVKSGGNMAGSGGTPTRDVDIPLPPITTQQQEAAVSSLLPTGTSSATCSVSPLPARITAITSAATSPGSTSRIASLSHSGHHGLNSSTIDDVQDM